MRTKPNILLIVTDQLRSDGLGCGGGWISTPNIDRISREGVYFENCFTTSPVCIPARLSLATGLYPHNTGIWDNCMHTLSQESPTWMRAIRKAGYRTSLFGKTHLHPHKGDLRDREDLMRGYGYDEIDEIGGPRACEFLLSHMTARWEARNYWADYRTDIRDRFATKPHLVRPSTLPLDEYYDCYVGRKAREYLEGYQRPEPWFCTISFSGPHEPWDTPEPYASKYAPEDMPAALPPPRDSGKRPKGALDRMIGNAPRLSEREIAEMRANYAGNVTLIDDQIGAVFEVMETKGWMDHTVILFTSDHGEMNGDAGLIYKSNMLRSAVSVPLLIRTPETATGNLAGSRNASPVEWIDAGPTLVELAGGELAHRQFGRSLLPILNGSQNTCRRDAISEINGEIMLADEAWKTVLNEGGEVYLLFDRLNDPEERHNLAGSQACQKVETDLKNRVLQRLLQSQLRLDGK
jgi:choline-sulfatase